jgi:hypothetical protein
MASIVIFWTVLFIAISGGAVEERLMPLQQEAYPQLERVMTRPRLDKRAKLQNRRTHAPCFTSGDSG